MEVIFTEVIRFFFLPPIVELSSDQQAMLSGMHGPTKQKAIRLLIDLGDVAGAEKLIPITHAHVSGVSPLTGGHGLRRFLSDLASDENGKVSIKTTLNSAGCDSDKYEKMNISEKDFLEHHFEIISAYEKLGVSMTLSCTPYDTDDVLEGMASWAESNAICFANSYSNLITNRESGLSALCSAITGYTPYYGLLIPENRTPNVIVNVSAEISDRVDYSMLADWIGRQIESSWNLPWGIIPLITGLPLDTNFDRRKAMSAAAANFGCALLYIDDINDLDLSEDHTWEGIIEFTNLELENMRLIFEPKHRVDLVTIGCPQASYDEIEECSIICTEISSDGMRIPDERLWVFTSKSNYQRAENDGLIEVIQDAGGLVLKDTCPEVVPYNKSKYKHILTNSMKAEHYLNSGLNSMPTSVSDLRTCIYHALFPENLDTVEGSNNDLNDDHSSYDSMMKYNSGELILTGKGVPSQEEWVVRKEALVTDVPITFLGYVNRDTGVIEEKGHPLDGKAIDDTILIFPRGSGSSVAPYVLMGLIYTGKGPSAVVNSQIDQQTLPACSLLGIPYAHSFENDPCLSVNTGDLIEMKLVDGVVTLDVIKRIKSK